MTSNHLRHTHHNKLKGHMFFGFSYDTCWSHRVYFPCNASLNPFTSTLRCVNIVITIHFVSKWVRVKHSYYWIPNRFLCLRVKKALIMIMYVFPKSLVDVNLQSKPKHKRVFHCRIIFSLIWQMLVRVHKQLYSVTKNSVFNHHENKVSIDQLFKVIHTNERNLWKLRNIWCQRLT